MKFIEYKDKYLDEVRDLLVELEEHNQKMKNTENIAKMFDIQVLI